MAGGSIEELGADGLYADQDRFMRFARGTPEDGFIDRGTAWPSGEIRECLEYGHIRSPEEGTAAVTLTVADGCERTLSLVVYSAPTEMFSHRTVDAQELLNATTETYGPGEHTISVGLPTDD